MMIHQFLELSIQKATCHLSVEKIPIVTHIIAYQELYYCPIPTNIIA